MIGVYKITCTANGKRYIGSSVNVSGRLAKHRLLLRHGTHYNRHLQSSWNKHGNSAFQFEPILECDPDAVRIWEKRIIDNVRPEFNAAGADPLKNLGSLSTETKAKISVALTGRKASDATRAKMSAASSNRSPETRAKMSASAKNRLPETLAGMSAANRNRNISPETRAKMSMSAKNRSPGWRENIRLGMLGKRYHLGHHHTEEAKARMSASAMGRRMSQETRAKISAAAKKQWAARKQRAAFAISGEE